MGDSLYIWIRGIAANNKYPWSVFCVFYMISAFSFAVFCYFLFDIKSMFTVYIEAMLVAIAAFLWTYHKEDKFVENNPDHSTTVNEENDKKIEDLEFLLNERVEKQRNEMEKMACALNGMNKCSRECIHFDMGLVYVSRLSVGLIEEIDEPRCKLWR